MPASATAGIPAAPTPAAYPWPDPAHALIEADQHKVREVLGSEDFPEALPAYYDHEHRLHFGIVPRSPRQRPARPSPPTVTWIDLLLRPTPTLEPTYNCTNLFGRPAGATPLVGDSDNPGAWLKV